AVGLWGDTRQGSSPARAVDARKPSDRARLAIHLFLIGVVLPEPMGAVVPDVGSTSMFQQQPRRSDSGGRRSERIRGCFHACRVRSSTDEIRPSAAGAPNDFIYPLRILRGFAGFLIAKGAAYLAYPNAEWGMRNAD